MRPRLLLAIALAQAVCLPVVACGARSELEVGDFDGNAGSRPDAAKDSSNHDAFVFDAGEEDALPPIDATPPNDAATCPTGLTAYLLTEGGDIVTFDPPTLATQNLGALHCPTSSAPWTLTAASSGLLYAIFEDWKIYQVNPADLSCVATSYHPKALHVGTEIGATVGPSDAGEVMFIYGVSQSGSPILADGDLQTFEMTEIGEVLPPPAQYPLDVRADAFGRIFGLSPSGTFVEIDPTTADVVAEDQTTFQSGASWALLTWDTDFYFFAGAGVSHYDLVSKTVTPIGNVGASVVGASAAPCIH